MEETTKYIAHKVKRSILKGINEGVKIGCIILTAAGMLKLTRIGWETLQARTGAPGGEILIIPMTVLLIYTGWTARKDWERYKRTERRMIQDEGRKYQH